LDLAGGAYEPAEVEALEFVAETRTQDTWRNLSHELQLMHLVTLATERGSVAQQIEVTAGQKTVLSALGLAEPPRFHDFRPRAA
jgi:hypothetical protein